MKRGITALALVAAGVFCGCARAPATRTGASAESAIRAVFQAALPLSATNSHVGSCSLVTRVVYGKFECSASDLPVFLAASSLLPDELEGGSNPLARIQESSLPWWQPASLQDVSGAECDWDAGADAASCTLVAGRNARAERTTVYFMVVYENKSQTGLRPEVKAEPNWGQQTNGISNNRAEGIGANHDESSR